MEKSGCNVFDNCGICNSTFNFNRLEYKIKMPKFHRFEKDEMVIDVYQSIIPGRWYCSPPFPIATVNQIFPLTGTDCLRLWDQSFFCKYWVDFKNCRKEIELNGWKFVGSGTEKPLNSPRRKHGKR